MKAKHKIGTLVQVRNEDGNVRYGTIDSVIASKDGYRYVLEGEDLSSMIGEEAIVAAFRPQVARQPRKTNGGGEVKRSKKRKAEAVTEDSAAA